LLDLSGITDPLEQQAILSAVSRLNSGAPLPYPRDGTVFHNREARLPAAPPAFYREYTVPTSGGIYYSPDHYGSFQRLR